jgi:hypothetical protein
MAMPRPRSVPVPAGACRAAMPSSGRTCRSQRLLLLGNPCEIVIGHGHMAVPLLQCFCANIRKQGRKVKRNRRDTISELIVRASQSELRRQHLETVADRAAGIAAEPGNGIELSRIDPQPFRIDDAVAIMRVDDLAHDDLPRLAELQRHMPLAFEGGRRLGDIMARRPWRPASPSARLPSARRRRADISSRRHASPRRSRRRRC